MRILLVEDDADHGAVLTDFFEEEGHQVELATNAPHALRLLGTLQPDVLFVDIALPVFDGNSLAAEIRKHAPSPPRLIAITGRGGSVQRALFDDVLVKPISPADLLKALVTPLGGGVMPVAVHGLVDDDPEDTLA